MGGTFAACTEAGVAESVVLERKKFYCLIVFIPFYPYPYEHDESRKEQRHFYCSARKQVSLLSYL